MNTRLGRMTAELNDLFGAPYGDNIADEFQRIGKKRVWEKPALLWSVGTDNAEQQDLVLAVMIAHHFAHPQTLPPTRRI